jgi:acyl-CoA synthetase (AMP-forming)/AMP-acid ligase II
MQNDTYTEAFRAAVERNGEQPLLTFLADGTGTGVTWTHLDLHREAGRVARLLLNSVNPGDRVLIVAAPGLDYVAFFFGCLYAGVIAVPAYPPSPLNGRYGLERLLAIVRDADIAAALVDDSVVSELAPFVPHLPVRLLTMEDARTAVSTDAPIFSAGADDVAFLQYTSGSTGEPKGVMVTQRNLVANIAMIGTAYVGRPGQTAVSWLPPYHDMGLIGMLLAPAVLDVHVVLMPPSAFLRQPVRWLRAIARFGAACSTAPNFAYETCVRKVKDADLDDVDLSTWRVAINGAEPIRASTVERFAKRFAVCGFRKDSFMPAYGLAETTLMAATGTLDDGASLLDVDASALENGRLRSATGAGDRRRLVTCGSPPAGTEITVIDPVSGAPLEAGRIGELVVRGPHVARGYWGREHDDDRFSRDSVRTGDLGTFLGGQLVVTGRVKDLMIIRGRNHYPHDVERTVEISHPAFRPGCGAAFTVDRDGEEQLVVVQEVAPLHVEDPAVVVDAVRRSVTIAHGISPDAVVLAAPGAVAKTTSGKIRRNDTRRMYLSSELATVFAWSSRSSPAGSGLKSTTGRGAAEPTVAP